MADSRFEVDTITTSSGDLLITFIGHGSVMFQHAGKVFQVDPFGRLADYSQFPKADLILITHEHPDHLDSAAIGSARKADTKFVVSEMVAKQMGQSQEGVTIMRNGDVREVLGVQIEAVPAYNIVQKREDGTAFHPKGSGNGYVVTFGGKRVYVAADTEDTPEMKALRNIDIAFLPMNLPYTMTPAQVAEAAKAFRPKVLYPYHFGDTDTSRLTALMKAESGIDVRIRRMA